MINLYVHYNSVTNHVMTRGISLIAADFNVHNFPHNLILAEAPIDFGRYDPQTNFKIIRGAEEVHKYMLTVQREKLRISNWMDFESIEMMHQLTPNEIAEILYLFHSSQGLRSIFFYKLQNNFVYLTLANGLTKTYYRHTHHFYPRFQRVVGEQMEELINADRSFFRRHETVSEIPLDLVERLMPLFSQGLKVNFAQAYEQGTKHYLPLNIIEDKLTLLTLDQRQGEHIAFIIYDKNSEQWSLEILFEEESMTSEDMKR